LSVSPFETAPQIAYTVDVEPVEALWLVSVSASAVDFLSAFRRYADRQGIFVPTADPLAVGKRGRIAITLADGQIMIEGTADVVSSSAKPAGLHGRSGMTLRFSDLDDDSKQVIAHLEKLRFASKVSTLPDDVRARPSRLPAGVEVAPAVDKSEKVIDPMQAFARCIVVGNRDALVDGARPKSITDAPSASAKFSVPAIPAIAAPSKSQPIAKATIDEKPIVAEPLQLEKKSPTGSQSVLVPSDTDPGVPEVSSVSVENLAPTATVLSPVILPQRAPAPHAVEPQVNTELPSTRTLRVAAVPAPQHSVSPFIPSATDPQSVLDEQEVTATTEMPVPNSAVMAAIAEHEQGQLAAATTPEPLPPANRLTGRHDEINPVTGNWTIALTPEGPSNVTREPKAPQFELAPSVTRVGNESHQVSGAVGGRVAAMEEQRPVGQSQSIEIADDLAHPSLQMLVARRPPEHAHVAPDPRSALPTYPELSQQPMYTTPVPNLAAAAFGTPDSSKYRGISDGGSGFFQSEESADLRPRYQTTPGQQPNKKRRNIIIAIAAVTVIAIMIAVAATRGGSDKDNNPPVVIVADAPVAAFDAVAPAIKHDATIDANDDAVEPSIPDVPPVAGKSCVVKLSSEPSGAEVSNNADVLGTTPFSVELPCDQATVLKFRKIKWVGVSKTVTPLTKVVSVNVRLAKPVVSVKVTSAPPGATVSVNGKVSGTTPTALKLTLGAVATVAVSKPGFVTATKKFTPKSNNENVHFALTKSKTR
jgi:hypothetical protein